MFRSHYLPIIDDLSTEAAIFILTCPYVCQRSPSEWALPSLQSSLGSRMYLDRLGWLSVAESSCWEALAQILTLKRAAVCYTIVCVRALQLR